MKAILEFNLPEEQDEFETINNAHKYWNVLWHFGNKYLRDKLKYEELTALEREIYEKVREKFWEMLEDEGIADKF